MMLIDEAWHLIRRDETGEYANDLARRARHLGLALIVMSQQLSDFNTDYGKALVRNSAQQLLLAQNPQEIPFIAETVELSEREANELGRLKTVKGRHAQMLWLNGARGHGKVTLRVGPSEYWAFTSDPTEVAIRDEAIAEHDGNVWAAINALARRGTRAHRDAAQGACTTMPRALSHRRGSAAASRPSASHQRDRTSADGRASARPAARGLRARRRGRRDNPGLPDRARRRPAAGRSGAGRRHGRAERRPRRLRRRRGPALAAASSPSSSPVGTEAERRSLRDRPGRTARSRHRSRVRLDARPRRSVGRLLAHAREAHGLTVIDCGTLARDADRAAAARRRTSPGCCPRPRTASAAAARVLASQPAIGGKELIVARNDVAGSQARRCGS